MRVKFHDRELKAHKADEQEVSAGELRSAAQMRMSLKQSLRYYAEKSEGGRLTIGHDVMDKSLDKCGERMAQRKTEQIKAAFSGDGELSLAKQAALRISLCVLNKEGKSRSCWMEGDSWAGVCHKLELDLLFEEEQKRWNTPGDDPVRHSSV